LPSFCLWYSGATHSGPKERISLRSPFSSSSHAFVYIMLPTIKDLHKKLFAGTVDEQLDRVTAGIYRRPSVKPRGRELPLAMEIPERLKELIKSHEKKKIIGLLDILGFHVQFEKLSPFDDGNGRVGRLILFKECLRHDVMPFIIDDKRRGRYLDGIREWDVCRDTLLEVVLEAQQRYGAQVELQKLLAANRAYLPADFKED